MKTGFFHKRSIFQLSSIPAKLGMRYKLNMLSTDTRFICAENRFATRKTGFCCEWPIFNLLRFGPKSV
jgi:hypothetical protein